MHRTNRFVFALATLACAAFIACSGGDESSVGTAGGSGSGAAAGSGSAVARAQQMSADGKSCVDLVKAKRFTDAIAPCERAVAAAANTGSEEVQQAFNEAKAAVQEEAEKAAMNAAAESLSGKDPGDATQEAAAGALKGLGGN